MASERVISYTFGMSASERPPICVWFDAFDESGRMTLFVSSTGRVRADYAYHPALKSLGPAWKRDAELGRDEVTALIAEIASDAVARASLPTTPRTPGKEVALSAIRAARGSDQPFLDTTFAETPHELERAVAELRRLFALAATKPKTSSAPQR